MIAFGASFKKLVKYGLLFFQIVHFCEVKGKLMAHLLKFAFSKVSFFFESRIA